MAENGLDLQKSAKTRTKEIHIRSENNAKIAIDITLTENARVVTRNRCVCCSNIFREPRRKQ